MSDWQPIGTAPQDGMTKVILGAWAGEYSNVMVSILEPLDSTQGDRSRPRAVHGMSIFYPTHWMHIPPPPRLIESIKERNEDECLADD